MSRSQTPPANTLLEVSASPPAVLSEVSDVSRSPSETNLLVVSYRDSPDAWVQQWRAAVGDLPSEVGFVHVGETTRSASAASGPVASSPASSGPAASSNRRSFPPDGTPLVETVADPADLSSVGIRVSEYLEAWDGNDRQSVVVFDSLTALLEQVELERAYRFLHVLSGRVESVEGRGYYLLDPEVHDCQSVSVVRQLADAVVDLDPTRPE